MNITYWSDFNCPYSYIGLKRLSDAVKKCNVEFEWHMKAFELEPNLKNTSTLSAVEKHAQKFGISNEKARKEIFQINEIALKSAIEMHLEKSHPTSSKPAHRLVKYMQKIDPTKAQELVFKIFESKFKTCENIADVDVLCEISKSLGFDDGKIKNILSSDRYEIEVMFDEEDAILSGINSTPCYIIEVNGEELIIPGVFEMEYLKIAINDLLSGKIIEKTTLL